MIRQLVSNVWKRDNPDHYNRELALYPEDLLAFVQETQNTQWQKFCSLYPHNPEQKFLERVAAQLNKADPNAADKERRIALISAAVTGKIDVRNWQAPEPSETQTEGAA